MKASPTFSNLGNEGKSSNPLDSSKTATRDWISKSSPSISIDPLKRWTERGEAHARIKTDYD